MLNAFLGATMKRSKFEKMSVDELWSLCEEVGSLLEQRILAEKLELQKRLDALGWKSKPQLSKARRPYPKVSAKFQNPAQPSQTWAGRGKRPRWVGEMLDAGKSMDDLRIPGTG
jgi:DNA-binding protein H-NS